MEKVWKNFLKTFQKGIDKGDGVWYNKRVVCKTHGYHEKHEVKNHEKNQKTFQKGIDKVKEMWYNNKAFDTKKGRSDWTLTIEQQKISTKHYYDSKELASAKYKSCQF